eukprot:113731-Rhodomonas_salina.1
MGGSGCGFREHCNLEGRATAKMEEERLGLSRSYSSEGGEDFMCGFSSQDGGDCELSRGCSPDGLLNDVYGMY